VRVRRRLLAAFFLTDEAVAAGALAPLVALLFRDEETA
jgi:hypothetical protein